MKSFSRIYKQLTDDDAKSARVCHQSVDATAIGKYVYKFHPGYEARPNRVLPGTYRRDWKDRCNRCEVVMGPLSASGASLHGRSHGRAVLRSYSSSVKLDLILLGTGVRLRDKARVERAPAWGLWTLSSDVRRALQQSSLEASMLQTAHNFTDLCLAPWDLSGKQKLPSFFHGPTISLLIETFWMSSMKCQLFHIGTWIFSELS